MDDRCSRALIRLQPLVGPRPSRPRVDHASSSAPSGVLDSLPMRWKACGEQIRSAASSEKSTHTLVAPPSADGLSAAPATATPRSKPRRHAAKPNSRACEIWISPEAEAEPRNVPSMSMSGSPATKVSSRVHPTVLRQPSSSSLVSSSTRTPPKANIGAAPASNHHQQHGPAAAAAAARDPYAARPQLRCTSRQKKSVVLP